MKKTALLLVTTLLITAMAVGQNTSPCPGLKNPASFAAGSTTGVNIGYWTGQTGTKPNQAPNALQGITGVNMTSGIIPAAQLATTVSSGSTSYCGSTLEPQKRFRIMSSTEGPGTGTQRGKDPNVNYSLPYVPAVQPGEEPFTNSIRLGNCITGAEAEGLFYNMKVRTQNALLFIYYSIVVQAPGHGAGQDPSFVIRVTRPSGGNYVQISDTLCYAVSSTGLVNGQNGWHSQGSGYNTIFYRDWNKVAVNLNKYVYETVRLEIYMGDCSQSGHYGYCYVAGDCQAMAVGSSGCPRGATDVVDTLTAPKGLNNYVWYRCNEESSNLNLMDVPESTPFVRISPETSTNNQFLCDTAHFRIHMTGSNGQDSIGLTNNQVFRCDMTSAMDPAKPFISKVYVRVTNTKPICSVDTVKSCESTISLVNKSFVPNMPNGCDTAKTKWWFYSGATDRTPVVDSIEFNTTRPNETRGKAFYSYPANTTGIRAVKMRSYSSSSMECFTDVVYPVRILGRPVPVLQASTHDLCDSDIVTLTDMTEHSVRRDWIFRRRNGEWDTIMGRRRNCPQTYSRGFEEYVNPVGMRTYNGDYSRDSVNTYDTVWCTNTVWDTIKVFSHPDIYRDGDSIVCKGDKTDITISTPTDSCTFKWYRTLYGTTPFASGDRLQVAPYADTSVYYVKVTSPKQCVAWDSVFAYMVIPTLEIDKTVMCDGDSVTLHSGAADHYSWSASPADPTLDRLLDSVGDGPSDITVHPRRTTTYTLVGHGTNGCSADPLTATVDVHALPVARIGLTPGFIDSDLPEVTFSDDSPHSVRSQWYFPNEEGPLEGTPIIHNFGEVSDSTVPVTLVAYNDLGCSDTTTIRVPVVLFTYYAPNLFTPERADNNLFRIYTTNEMEHFHITIYDRRGQMVYRSDDLHFEWDGTRMDGTKCPQGTYVFVVTYRRPNTEDIVTQKGTVTIVR